MDALIEAAGNTIEAFVTAPIFYDMVDMDFVNAITWLRRTRKYVEFSEGGNGLL